MQAWWTNLSARERMLIAIAGGLVALFVLVFAVITPTLTARAQAERSYTDAARLLGEVRDGAALITALRPAASGDGAPQVSLRGAVAESAQRFGVQITRVQPLASGAVNVVIEETPPESILRWILTLNGEYDIAVTKASMNRRAVGGAVNANLMLTQASDS